MAADDDELEPMQEQGNHVYRESPPLLVLSVSYFLILKDHEKP